MPFGSHQRSYADIQSLLQFKPVTFLGSFVLGAAGFAGLLATFVFIDQPEDPVIRGALCFAGFALLALAYAFAAVHEHLRPYPLWFRRLLWHAVVWSYVLSFMLTCGLCVLAGQLTPAIVRLLLGFGPILPLPYLCWVLIRQDHGRKNRDLYC